MLPSLPRRFGFLALALSLAGCAQRDTVNRRGLAAVRRVAVNYATPAGAEASGSRAKPFVDHAMRQGVSIGLGALNLGLVGGLVWDAIDLSTPGANSGKADVSREVLAVLREAKTDPAWLVAQRTEQEIARRRLFAVTRANPDAVCDFEVRRAAMAPVDKLGLAFRPVLTVRARLRDRTGATLWSKEASATAAAARSWQEYRERPQRLRGDFDALAASIARQLVDDLAR